MPAFACIAIFLPVTSLAAEAPRLRVLVLDSKDLYFKADRQRTLILKGIFLGKRNIKSLKVKVDRGQIKYSLNGDLSKWFDLDRNKQIRIRTRDPRGIWLGKRRYGGELRLLNKGNSIWVINYLNIEKYLKSVVGSEMPKDWPLEALKAQAVASRTYALNQSQKKKKKEFDVNSSVSSQVYLGIEAETNSTHKAVDSTRSLVLVHKGSLIDAVFHTCSGGITEASIAVWGKHKPYLVSTPDYYPNISSCKWEKKFEQKQLQDIFSKIGGFNAIRITKQTQTGRIASAKIYGSKGIEKLSGKELRSRLNLKSTLAKFEILSSYNNNEKINFFLDSFSLPSIEETSQSNNLNYGLTNDLVSQISLPPLPNKKSLVVRGYGSGHAVGMSQWGAKDMAEKGMGFKKILRYFYKGVKITSF